MDTKGGKGVWNALEGLGSTYIQCVHVLNHVSPFATSWTVARQAPLPMRFSRQECWSGLPCPPPGDLPDSGTGPTSLMSPVLVGRFFTTSTTWEAPNIHYYVQNR